MLPIATSDKIMQLELNGLAHRMNEISVEISRLDTLEKDLNDQRNKLKSIYSSVDNTYKVAQNAYRKNCPEGLNLDSNYEAVTGHVCVAVKDLYNTVLADAVAKLIPDEVKNKAYKGITASLIMRFLINYCIKHRDNLEYVSNQDALDSVMRPRTL